MRGETYNMNNTLKQNLYTYLISLLTNERILKSKDELEKLYTLEVLPNEH